MLGIDETIGVLGYPSIRQRLKGLKDARIEMSAQEILQLPPEERPPILKRYREQGFIFVDPPFSEEDLDPKNKKSLLGTVSLDLEFGDTVCVHANPHSHPVDRKGILEDQIVDLTRPETIRSVEEHDYLCKLEKDQCYVLAPGELVKGFTQRYFFMPYDLMGMVVGRSKVGRFGVTTTVDAPKIDPGFAGRIVLELAHHGAYRFALSEGLAIAQIIFFSVEGKIESGYDETHDSYSRNENINYMCPTSSFMNRKVITRLGVYPIEKGEENAD